MSVPVVAVIGAGASHASGRFAAEAKPPLTKDLFKGPTADDLLKKYIVANNAGRAVARKMRSDSTLAFEQALLSLREDGSGHRRQLSLALPPYLQALMLSYSAALHADAERYFLLIDELLTLETDIYFVSLNYDTLLDIHLSGFSALHSIDDYVSGSRQWSLLKPHGSANWFVELDDLFDPTAPPEGFAVPDGPIRCTPARSHELHIVRETRNAARAHELTRRYPAIALPEGPKDRLVLPADHLEFFTTRLAHTQELDLLVLGYSALDTEVLDLIRQSRCRVRRMTIVNRDPYSALEVYDTISAHGIAATWPDTFDGAYEEWIDQDGLQRWVAEYGGVRNGPYPSLTSPDQLRDRVAVREIESRHRAEPRDDIMRQTW